MIGDDVDVAMDSFPVERGSAQLDIFLRKADNYKVTENWRLGA